MEIPQKKGDPVIFDTDEYPKFGASLEKMAKLKPAFKKDGTVTAANASGINDGAAALVVMSKEKAQELGLNWLCEVVAYATGGVDPSIMGVGPIASCTKALAKADMTIDDIDSVSYTHLIILPVILASFIFSISFGEPAYKIPFNSNMMFPPLKWINFVKVFALDSIVPGFIKFIFVYCHPSINHAKLFGWNRTGKKFAVHTDDGLIVPVKGVDVGLMVLLCIIEIQGDNNSVKSA